jgi:predicted tellurium resistance membrane protein TerC
MKNALTSILAFSDPAAGTAALPASSLEGLFTVENMIAAAALTLMEIVLGVDNIVFVAIIAGRVPKEQRARIRTIGLAISVALRVIMLFGLSWIIGMKKAIFTFPILNQDMTMRDILLLCGGLFLLYSSTKEIHGKIEGDRNDGHGAETASSKAAMAGGAAIAQIALINVVFSLDSIFTAVGMVKNIWIMVAAVLASTVVMIVSSGAIGGFIDRHPTIKMLALSFLLLIGVMLVGEAFHQEIPKGYIYFGMGFSLLVEMLNLRARSKAVKRAHQH